MEKSIRVDGREVFTPRKEEAEFMNKPGKETDNIGHLMYAQGNTKIIVKTYAEITAPKPDRPSQGFVLFNVNCQAAEGTHDQNKKTSIEITKLLEKIVIGSNTLDPESLCIVSGRYVWEININCIVVRDDGNLIDTVLNGVIMGLMDMRKPLVSIRKDKVELEEKKQMLSLAHTPFSFTFGLISNTIFLDPTLKEEVVLDTKITITINIYNEICSIHKPGGLGITNNILTGAIAICEKKIKEKTELMRKLVR